MEHNSGKKLLLVEDEVIQAMTGKIALEKYGYRVVTASSGEKAVEVVANTQDIDLILMDIDLGNGIDGTEAAAIILKNRDLPVVFLSSHTESAIVEKTEKITSYGYVVKNSSITVLDASIKMAFKLFDAKISEKKKEELLRINELKYQTLFDHSPISIWEEDFSAIKKRLDQVREQTGGDWRAWFDRNPDEVAVFASLVKIIDINNTGATYLMGEKKELIETNLSSYFSEDSLVMFKEELIALASGKTYFETEISVRAPVDGPRVLFLCLSVAPGFTDTLSCVIVSFFDITERKRAEEALQSSNELFQTILNTIPQAICWKDLDSVFLGCNAKYAKMVGCPDTQSIVGKTDWDLPWKKEETEHFRKDDRMIMDTDSPRFNIIEPAFDAEGTEKILETSKAPLHDKNGKVCGIMVACQDKTASRTE